MDLDWIYTAIKLHQFILSTPILSHLPPFILIGGKSEGNSRISWFSPKILTSSLSVNMGVLLLQINDIYGFEVNESLVTGIANKIMPEIEEWQKRPLSAVYPIVFIDAIVFNVRDNGVIKKQAAYIIIGISKKDKKRC